MHIFSVAGLEADPLQPVSVQPYFGVDFASGKIADGFDFKRTLVFCSYLSLFSFCCPNLGQRLHMLVVWVLSVCLTTGAIS